MQKFGLAGVIVFGVIAVLFVQLPPMVAKQDAMYNTFRALVEVNALAKQRFVEEIEDDRLVDGAIRGMLLKLDPYSGYIAPHELTGFMRRNAGEYIGVGVEFGVQDGKLTVISPLADSPASHAGILAGDTILAIDGQRADGLSVFDLTERLSGAPGSTVVLRVLHAGETSPENIEVIRGPVSIQTVRGVRRVQYGQWDYMIEPAHGIAYIRVSNFHENTMPDFDAALRDILQRNTRALIIDLRFNPGGLLDQAVTMVDRFVKSGLIVETVTRRKAVNQHHATPDGANTTIPLAVLINGGSASCSEVVAGSLQDHGRAAIVGERSFGKASVQHVIELGTHPAAIKLTVAHYRLPSGRIIHRAVGATPSDDWGVRPSVEVVLSDAEVAEIQASRRSLDRAYRDASAGPGGPFGKEPGSDAPSATIVRDRQLEAAITHLRESMAVANANIGS